MTKTKTTICLILLAAVILSVLSPVFLGLNKSYAAPGDIPNTGNPDIAPKTPPPPPKSDEESKKEAGEAVKSALNQAVKSPCGRLDLFGSWACFKLRVAQAMFGLVFWTTNKLTYFGGMFFNAAIFFSLSGQAFDTTQNSLISTGWKATRDFANLFFIFIILYIAIATILQLSGYGSKSLLIKVIIIALFINFSLTVTKVVIDASHVLAWEFYSKIDVSGGGQYLIADEDESGIKIKEDIGLTEEEKGKKDLSAVFMAGFNPQKLVGGQAQQDKQKKILNDGAGVEATLMDIILIYLLASILNLVAAFILFAGGILFIIRVVVLWFVMILAPLAFVGMILPGKMAGFAKTWWDKLFSQSFFAPAFLFLFYLVTVMINSKFLQNMIASSKEASPGYGDTLVVIFHFIIIVGLTIGCLIIAQQMGAHGANIMAGWGKKLQGVAQGYVGRGAAHYPRKLTGYAGKKVATSEGKWAKTLRFIPGAARLGAYAASQNRAKIAEAQKSLDKYNDKEIQNMLGNITGKVMPFTRAAMIQELTKRKELKETLPQYIEGAKGTMKRYGMKTGDIDKLRPDLVKGNVGEYVSNLEKEAQKDPAKKTQYAGVFKKIEEYQKTGDRNLQKELQRMADEAAQETVIKKIKSSDIEAVGDQLYESDALIKMAMKYFGSSHAQKIIEKGGIAAEKFFGELVKLGDNYEDVAEKLERNFNNRSLAAWANSFSGNNFLDSYAAGKKGWINSDVHMESKKTKKTKSEGRFHEIAEQK